MHNLGMAYLASGQPTKAVPLLAETVKKRKVKLAPDHPDTLHSMHALAAAYRDSGQLDKTVVLLEETLEKMRARLGPNHRDTLTCMNNLAMAFRARGMLARALPLFEETLEKRKVHLGPDHPDTLNTMGNLGSAYAAAKQGDKAATVLLAFVDGARKNFPKDSTTFAGLLAEVSIDLLGCGQYPAAEQLLRECLAIRQKTQPRAWSTFNTMSLLGAALLGQKKYPEAEPFLLKGYEGMMDREKAIPPQANTCIPEAIDRLIAFYAATDKPDERKKWQIERARYPVLAPPPREK
jgi:tetratricopeptide (TPR) repeat protein